MRALVCTWILLVHSVLDSSHTDILPFSAQGHASSPLLGGSFSDSPLSPFPSHHSFYPNSPVTPSHPFPHQVTQVHLHTASSVSHSLPSHNFQMPQVPPGSLPHPSPFHHPAGGQRHVQRVMARTPSAFSVPQQQQLTSSPRPVTGHLSPHLEQRHHSNHHDQLEQQMNCGLTNSTSLNCLNPRSPQATNEGRLRLQDLGRPSSKRKRRCVQPRMQLSQSLQSGVGFLQPPTKRTMNVFQLPSHPQPGHSAQHAQPAPHHSLTTDPYVPPQLHQRLGPLREPDAFESTYRVGPILGKGGFGTVFAGIRNSDGLDVAIKEIAKSKVNEWGMVSRSI